MTVLRRVITLRTVVSASAGLAMATSCYLAGLQVAIIVVGELAWISILVAGLLCLLSAMCFAELISLYPTAAGIKLFIESAFNERAAISLAMFYVILGISIVGAESYVLSSVLSDAILIFNPFLDKCLWILFFILLVGYINYRGVKLTGWVQDILTYGMLSFLILVALYTFWVKGVNIGTALESSRFTLENVLMAAGVGVFLYVAFEWVTPLAEETTDYRMVGRGMMIAIGLLAVTYSLFVVAMYTGLTEEQLNRGTAIPHILFARNLFGTPGGVIFILMSIVASVTSFNSGLLNNSRYAYAMARDNVFPRFFSRLHPVYATPWVSILALMVFAIVVSLFILLTGKYLFLIVMAAALECFIYVVMAACVMRLRRRKPDMERAYRVPLGNVVPIVVIVVFAGLMLGIFADTSKDYRGNVLFQNYWVAVVMILFAALMVLYALTIVPRLRRRAEVRAAQRKRRRPGRGDEQ
jgi:amino acid transporter